MHFELCAADDDPNVTQLDTDQSASSSNDPDTGQPATTFQTWTNQQLPTAARVGQCTAI